MHSTFRGPTTILLIGAAVAVGLAACNKAPPPAQSSASAAAAVVTDTPPPPLPVYAQPPIPAAGYMWTPGYWAWNDGADDYYWVPGTWAQPPRAGLYWTPGYWEFRSGRYAFNPGYWGSRVGFYGGIDYGYGYGGSGYQGGRWQGDRFQYNTAVNSVGNAHIRDVYRQTVVARQAPSHVSFSGGGGASARASSAELEAARAQRIEPTPVQNQHLRLAGANPGLRASVNRGRPAIAATPRPAMFAGPGVVTDARTETPYRPPVGRPRPAQQFSATMPTRSAPEARPATATPNFQPRSMERAAPAHQAPPPAHAAPPPARQAEATPAPKDLHPH
jgi:hypothetical protein